MSEELTNIVLLEPVIDSMAALVKLLEKTKQLEIHSVSNADETLQVAQQFLPCVLLVSIRGSLDGASQVEMLKKLEKPIRSGQLKVLVISTVKNHPLAKNVTLVGVTDYVEEPVATKSLLFKMNLILKAVKSLRKRSGSNGSDEIIFKSQPNESKVKNKSIHDEASAKYKPALQLAEDIFVFKGVKPRKVGQKYLLEAEGPLPETGEWVCESSSQDQWSWIPNLDTEEEIVEGGSWVYEGDKPTFDPGVGKWKLQAKKPQLSFVKDGRRVAAKVETNEEGKVVIAEDSKVAFENLTANKTIAIQRQSALKKKSLVLARMEKEKNKRDQVTLEPLNEDLSSEKKRREIDVQEKRKDSLRRPLEFTAVDRKQKTEKESEKILDPEREILKRSISGEAENSHKLEKEIKENPEKDSEEANRLEKFESELDENIVSIKVKEKLLQGLKTDDLTGIQNLRDKMREDLQLNLEKEKDLLGISDKKLAGDSSKNDAPRAEVSHLKKQLEKLDVDGEEESDYADSKIFDKQENEIETEDYRKTSKSLNPKRMAEKRAIARVAYLKKKVDDELSRPLRDKLSKEEEREIRHEVGSASLQELDHKELDRLARSQKVKHLKKTISDISESLEGRGVPIEALFPPEDANDWNEADSTREEKRRSFRAIESIEQEDQEELYGSIRKSKSKVAEKNDPGALFYLERTEVLPLDGFWEREGHHWVYLPSSIFELGVVNFEGLFPLWIFQGDIPPVIEMIHDRWKFESKKPRQISNLNDLPKPLRDFLLNLHLQSEMALGKSGKEQAKEERLNEVDSANEAASQLTSGSLSGNDDKPQAITRGTRADEVLNLQRVQDANFEKDSEKRNHPADEFSEQFGKVHTEIDLIGSTGEVKLRNGAEGDLGKVSIKEPEREDLEKVSSIEIEDGNSGNLRAEDEELEKIGKVLRPNVEPESGSKTLDSNGFEKDYAGVDRGIFLDGESEDNYRLNLRELMVLVIINDVLRAGAQDWALAVRFIEQAIPESKIQLLPGTLPDHDQSLHGAGASFSFVSGDSGEILTLIANRCHGRAEFSKRELYVFGEFSRALEKGCRKLTKLSA